MTPMKTLLITHVWNDELYLRGWLRHHKGKFTHGVIIYYESEDATRAIIEEEVPGWDVVPPTTPMLTTGPLERQIEELEARYPGWWKICLTVTEFLITGDLDAELSLCGVDGFYLSGYGLVDSPEERQAPYDPALPVIEQRAFGFPMAQVPVAGRNGGRRYFHRRDHGHYAIGRHWTLNPAADHAGALFLVRAFYSPFNEAGLRRKLAMRKNISAQDIAEGRCWQHFYSAEQMNSEYNYLLLHSRNLAGCW